MYPKLMDGETPHRQHLWGKCAELFSKNTFKAFQMVNLHSLYIFQKRFASLLDMHGPVPTHLLKWSAYLPVHVTDCFGIKITTPFSTISNSNQKTCWFFPDNCVLRVLLLSAYLSRTSHWKVILVILSTSDLLARSLLFLWGCPLPHCQLCACFCACVYMYTCICI